MIATNLHVRWASGPSEIEQLGADWDSLPQAQHDPLLGHAWLASAGAAFSEATGPLFLVIERKGRLEACAPLQETRRRGVRWLEIVGASALGEPAGLVYRDDASLDALCLALSGLGCPLVLARISGEERLAERLSIHGNGRAIALASPPVLQVQFGRGWQSYLAGRSSECRSGFRRKRRRLEESGPVVLERHRPVPTQAESLLQCSFEIEDDGWKGRAGSSVLQRPLLRRFLVDAGRRLASEGKLLVHFLAVGGQRVATLIAIEHDRRLWELKIGYREKFAAASPGRLLLWEVLRDACERGLDGYEFLGSGDGQQADWANAQRTLETVIHYPYSLEGAWAIGSDVASHMGRRLRRVLGGQPTY